MEKNIFENAKFGDKFLTRDGKIAIFQHKTEDNTYSLITEDCSFHVNEEGLMDFEFEDVLCFHERYPEYDIVSRYKESTNDDILSKLAFESCPYEVTINPKAGPFFEGYFAGYKDKENNKIPIDCIDSSNN